MISAPSVRRWRLEVAIEFLLLIGIEQGADLAKSVTQSRHPLGFELPAQSDYFEAGIIDDLMNLLALGKSQIQLPLHPPDDRLVWHAQQPIAIGKTAPGEANRQPGDRNRRDNPSPAPIRQGR